MLNGMTQAEVYACVARGDCLGSAVSFASDPATGVLRLVFALNPRKVVRKIKSSKDVTDGSVRYARCDYNAEGLPVQLEIHPFTESVAA